MGRRGDQRGDRAGGGPAGLLGTAYGIWKENQLDKEVWQVIDERVSAPADAGPEAPTGEPGST